MAEVLLDACCLVNLFSSGRAAEILESLPHTWHVCDAVRNETLFVDVSGDAGVERSKIDLVPLVLKGTLKLCAPSGAPEIAAFVNYAVRLDDGEAMCLGLATCRSWTVATDERKGRRIAIEDGIAILSTPQIIRAWCDTRSVEKIDVRHVIEQITLLGRYRPAGDIPDSEWWFENSR